MTTPNKKRAEQYWVARQKAAEKEVRLPKGWSKAARRVKVATPEGEKSKEITYYKNTLGMEFVKIPAGEFMMGSGQSPQEVARLGGGKAECYKNEGPQHRVRITMPFYMGAFEVTQEQYEKVMSKNPAYFKGARNPVEQVSWHDAVEFCKRLSKRDGLTYRLPTEAEWEYVCRAGTTTPFHTGETISTDQANYKGNYTYGRGQKGKYRKETVPVGSFASNAFGLYDMHGNVWEWCSSLYKDYPYRSHGGREDLRAAGSRVLRGGSWLNNPRDMRSANRDRGSPAVGGRYCGFRICAVSQESF